MAQPAGDPRADVRQEVERLLGGAQIDPQQVLRLGGAALRLQMSREADLLLDTAVRVLHAFIRRGDAPRALSVEGGIYNTFVKAFEDEDHYERCFALWREAMAGLGRAHARPLPPRAGAGPGLRVGFVFHTASVLGHTEVLLRLLETRDRAAVHPRLYALFGESEELAARAAALGVPLETNPGAGAPQDWLRARMAANGEGVAVWVSAPPASLYVLGTRVAPVQVFWSLKHHPIRSRDIDGYLTYGSWSERERVFHGQPWTVCPVPLALDPRPRSPEAVRALRASFPQRVLLGTLAREEKIDSRPFLEAVAAILERNPDAGWIWTGRARHPGVDHFFRSRGLADRCHFVGWVDTPLYAAILDVFLETFPLGCGITGYQALAAGVPLLSYLEPNTVFGMQYWSDVGGARGEAVPRETLDASGVLVARDPKEYVELASRLAADAAFRAEWTTREQGFYEREILAIDRYARRFFDTIAAIRPAGAAA